MAATISLCMIVRNEEKVLARCLESVRGCVDEIVIVDTGSSDATKEIAARYTDRIYDFEWIDDFSAARNYAFEQATGTICSGSTRTTCCFRPTPRRCGARTNSSPAATW